MSRASRFCIKPIMRLALCIVLIALMLPGTASSKGRNRWVRKNDALQCLNDKGHAIKRIDLSKKLREERRGKKRIRVQETISAEASANGQRLGLIRGIQEREIVEKGEGEDLKTESNFELLDDAGNLRWKSSNVDAFKLSDSASRVLLRHYEPLTREQKLEGHIGLNHQWLSIYDDAGEEVFRFDPGEKKLIGQYGLTRNGRFGIANRACFSVASKEVHRPPEKIKGALQIQPDGRCQIVKYLREVDADGKQKVDVLYEYVLK